MCQRHGVYIWIATGVEICRGQSEAYWNLVSPGFSARLPVSLLTTSRGRVYAAHSIGTRFSSYVFFLALRPYGTQQEMDVCFSTMGDMFDDIFIAELISRYESGWKWDTK